jgi:hypothetical protein
MAVYVYNPSTQLYYTVRLSQTVNIKQKKKFKDTVLVYDQLYSAKC